MVQCRVLKLNMLWDTVACVNIHGSIAHYNLKSLCLNISLFDPTGLFQSKATPDSIKAFQSFVGIAPAPPVENYENFTKVVNRYLESPPFNFINPYRQKGRMKIVSTVLFNELQFVLKKDYTSLTISPIQKH